MSKERMQQLEDTLPRVNCKLVGEDGNAFSIMGRFSREARRAKWSSDAIDEVLTEARSGNYDHLLYTISRFCDEPESEKED